MRRADAKSVYGVGNLFLDVDILRIKWDVIVSKEVMSMGKILLSSR